MRRAAVLLALLGALALPLGSAGLAVPVATALLPDSVVVELSAMKSSVLAMKSCVDQVKSAVGVAGAELDGRSGTLMPTCWTRFISPQGYTSRI